MTGDGERRLLRHAQRHDRRRASDRRLPRAVGGRRLTWRPERPRVDARARTSTTATASSPARAINYGNQQGDYEGLVSYGGVSHPIWTDSRRQLDPATGCRRPFPDGGGLHGDGTVEQLLIERARPGARGVDGANRRAVALEKVPPVVTAGDEGEVDMPFGNARRQDFASSSARTLSSWCTAPAPRVRPSGAGGPICRSSSAASRECPQPS